MKLDMDLGRQIMLELEACQDINRSGEVKIEGRTEEEIVYHVMLLHEAGLIHAIDASDSGGLLWIPDRLTFSGHEFLEKSRNEGMWKKAKAMAIEKTGAVTLELISKILSTLTFQALGMGPS